MTNPTCGDTRRRSRCVLFSLWFGLWPLFLGIFLPYVPFGGDRRLLNVFWSLLYGFGLWSIDHIVGLSNSTASSFLLFGGLIWPTTVSLALFVFGWRLCRGDKRRMRATAVLVLAASSLAMVDLNLVYREPFSSLPTYFQLLSVVY
jgi:hypothetical protein